MSTFEDLTYWIKAKELSLAVYSLMQNCKDFGFKDQIQRAAVSIMNNIAEGSEFGSPQGFIKHLNIARGSCAEVRSMLYLCYELDYCSEDQMLRLIDITRFISSAIFNHIRYLKTI